MIALIFVVHPHHHQRAPVDALFESLDSRRELAVGVVTLRQLIGGNLKSALLCLVRLPLGFQLGPKVRL